MKVFNLVLIGTFLTALLMPGSPDASVAAAAANLLQNPGFEDGFHVQGGAGEVSVADGWTAWWVQGSQQQANQGYLVRPEYKAEDGNIYGFRRIHSGRYAQKFFSSFSTHDAGLFQKVDVPAGATLQFTAWAQTWSSGGDNPDEVVEPGFYQVSIGIDPTGGTNPVGNSVIWSTGAYPNNSWAQLSVTAAAQGSQVTVFTRGAPQYRVKHNDSYWDDLGLIQVSGPPPAAPTPTPAAPPAPTPTPGAQPAPTPEPATGGDPETYVVQAGDTLFRIALRFSTTVQDLIALNGIDNPNYVWVGQRLLIRGGGGQETPPPPTAETGTYTVQPGDGLGAIALLYNTTVETLISLNSIINPNLIYVGQELKVPGGAPVAPSGPITHTVQPGEMLSAIAAQYGVSMWAIVEANNLTNINLIWVGQQLVIPTS